MIGAYALFRADLDALLQSWVLRGWIAALGLYTFFTLIAAFQRRGETPAIASTVIAEQLLGYLVLWSTVIIVLCAGAVSSESDVVADGILSRACSRPQYILAKVASRAAAVLGVYLAFSGIAAYAASRFLVDDVSAVTLATGIGVVGLALLLLVALGVMMSVLADNTVVAVVATLLLWYVASPVFHFVGAAYLSPVSLIANLPILLKDTEAPAIEAVRATATSVTITFTLPVTPETAENIDGYTLRSGMETLSPKAAVIDESNRAVVLSGLSLDPGVKVNVVATGPRGRTGAAISPAGNYGAARAPGRPKAEANRRGSAAPARGVDAEASGSDAPDRIAVSRTGNLKTSEHDLGPAVTRCAASGGNARVWFDRELDLKSAEKVRNYLIESPPGTVRVATGASYHPSSHMTLLTGLDLPKGAPLRVTVTGIRDRDGTRIRPGRNVADYVEVTPWRYLAGFGLPILLSMLVSLCWFNRRDL